MPEMLLLYITDVFLRLNIPVERIYGYFYDGANYMSSWFSGVQAHLKEICPDSLFVHCSNHSLDVAQEVHLVADPLNFVQSIYILIRESAKCKLPKFSTLSSKRPPTPMDLQSHGSFECMGTKI